MERFNIVSGIVAPLDRSSVDTDQIIPKQFLKSIRRSGFGPNLFDGWRYLDVGAPGKQNSGRPLNPAFVLNQSRYQGASILLARDNFGCGSSREHAAWALRDYGFRAIIAPSFGDIFFFNCFKNGLLAVKLRDPEIDQLFFDVISIEGFRLTVDLGAQLIVHQETGRFFRFEIDDFQKRCLQEGLDEIGLTLKHVRKVLDFERRRQREQPWLL